MTSAVLIVLVIVLVTPYGNELLAGAVMLVFVVGYVLLGRPGLSGPGQSLPVTWRGVAFLVVVCVTLLVGTAADQSFATMQMVAYPLAWNLLDRSRVAVAVSAAMAGSTGMGYAAAESFRPVGLGFAAMVTVLSFGFSVWIGMWFTNVETNAQTRIRLATELAEAQTEIAALSRARGAAQERERIARDVHDTVAQSLAGVVMLAERAGRAARVGDVQRAADSVSLVEAAARDALAEARALVAQEAAPPGDDAFDAAVGRLAERFRAHGEAEITVTGLAGATGLPGEVRLDQERQIVVLRCLQELLSNAQRHAHASTVQVQVGMDASGTVILLVTDDGRGFDPDAVVPGFGLEGLRERVGLAGGSLEVDSGDSGTRVQVQLPGSAPSETAEGGGSE